MTAFCAPAVTFTAYCPPTIFTPSIVTLLVLMVTTAPAGAARTCMSFGCSLLRKRRCVQPPFTPNRALMPSQNFTGPSAVLASSSGGMPNTPGGEPFTRHRVGRIPELHLVAAIPDRLPLSTHRRRTIQDGLIVTALAPRALHDKRLPERATATQRQTFHKPPSAELDGVPGPGFEDRMLQGTPGARPALRGARSRARALRIVAVQTHVIYRRPRGSGNAEEQEQHKHDDSFSGKLE